MSVLLVGLEHDVARAVIGRLVAQDDEVRTVENDPGRAAEYKALGAFIATGDAGDADLIERAAQNVRTIVVGEALGEHLAAVEEGARLARVERIVFVGSDRKASAPRPDGIGQRVLVWRGKKGLLRDARVTPEETARAIDAADDLGGEPDLDLDLRDAESWRALGLEAEG